MRDDAPGSNQEHTHKFWSHLQASYSKSHGFHIYKWVICFKMPKLSWIREQTQMTWMQKQMSPLLPPAAHLQESNSLFPIPQNDFVNLFWFLPFIKFDTLDFSTSPRKENNKIHDMLNLLAFKHHFVNLQFLKNCSWLKSNTGILPCAATSIVVHSL